MSRMRKRRGKSSWSQRTASVEGHHRAPAAGRGIEDVRLGRRGNERQDAAQRHPHPTCPRTGGDAGYPAEPPATNGPAPHSDLFLARPRSRVASAKAYSWNFGHFPSVTDAGRTAAGTNVGAARAGFPESHPTVGGRRSSPPQTVFSHCGRSAVPSVGDVAKLELSKISLLDDRAPPRFRTPSRDRRDAGHHPHRTAAVGKDDSPPGSPSPSGLRVPGRPGYPHRGADRSARVSRAPAPTGDPRRGAARSRSLLLHPGNRGRNRRRGSVRP